MNRHEQSTTRSGRRRSPRRPSLRGALALLALASIATAGAAAVSPATAAPAGKAKVTVTKLSGVPRSATAGTKLAVTTTVRNSGSARVAVATLTFRLSRDARVDGKDVRLSGTERIRGLAPRSTRKVKGAITLPKGSAAGTYYVFACAGTQCKGAKTAITQKTPDRGTLTGMLTLTRLTPLEEGTTLEQRANATISMAYSKSAGGEDVFASTGGMYDYRSSYRKEVVSHQCTTTTERTAAGSGGFKYSGDPYTDDILAKFARLDRSQLRLLVNLHYTGSTTTTRTGDDTCSPGKDVTEPKPALNMNDILLTEVERTATDITYRASTWTGSGSTTSDWEHIDGTLKLHLG